VLYAIECESHLGAEVHDFASFVLG